MTLIKIYFFGNSIIALIIYIYIRKIKNQYFFFFIECIKIKQEEKGQSNKNETNQPTNQPTK